MDSRCVPGPQCRVDLRPTPCGGQPTRTLHMDGPIHITSSKFEVMRLRYSTNGKSGSVFIYVHKEHSGSITLL